MSASENKSYIKYANRHIYSYSDKGYVELPDILDDIKKGYGVQITDSKTKLDLTYKTLLEGLRKLESENTSSELLKRIIRSPEGSFTNYILALEEKLQVIPTNQEIHPTTLLQ